MSRYSGRSATSGAVTLNSARKGGHTLQFSFFRKDGRKWLEFDIREVAKVAGAELPEMISSEELREIRGNSEKFECLLRRDLQRVADWCAHIDADGSITKRVAL